MGSVVPWLVGANTLKPAVHWYFSMIVVSRIRDHCGYFDFVMAFFAQLTELIL